MSMYGVCYTGDMKIAIIGTGFLGEAVFSVVTKRNVEVVTTYNTNKKFKDSLQYDFFNDDPKDIFPKEKIDIVILTAMLEFTEDERALERSVKCFLEYFLDTRVVYISSDGIFDGSQGNYTESDIPHPITLYGRNLELYENLVREHAKNHCIVRPSYMYGFVGGKLDTRLKQVREEVAQGNKITRFTDMYKSPLSYRQASEAITALAFSRYIGTVHIAGPRMSVYDFTRQGMEALGVSTELLVGGPMPIPRPQGFLPDTSLNYDLMGKLTRIKPKSIAESLKKK